MQVYMLKNEITEERGNIILFNSKRHAQYVIKEMMKNQKDPIDTTIHSIKQLAVLNDEDQIFAVNMPKKMLNEFLEETE